MKRLSKYLTSKINKDYKRLQLSEDMSKSDLIRFFISKNFKIVEDQSNRREELAKHIYDLYEENSKISGNPSHVLIYRKEADSRPWIRLINVNSDPEKNIEVIYFNNDFHAYWLEELVKQNTNEFSLLAKRQFDFNDIKDLIEKMFKLTD